ncbi:MAG: hypothetical protein OEW58_10780 [Gammaproteobacteria bacterium]|nr:hypothetical protein [Gammaproteobacteria bacterium]
MTPCYVSGKGMYATVATWDFKTHVMELLNRHELGFDTRYAYYRQQFPQMRDSNLARMICDPMEYYDKQWPAYRETHAGRADEWVLATEFMLALDLEFQAQAQCAIFCYDEAGFGSGVNNMRMLVQNKPVLGFYHRALESVRRNISNFLQLRITHPHLVTLVEYETIADLEQPLLAWFESIQPQLNQR